VFVEVLGAVRVIEGSDAVSGRALGGRRARVALVALALAQRPMPAEQLAAIIWGDETPNTWPVALRGVIRGLRLALADVGGGEQAVIATVPTGYALASGVGVDVASAAVALERGQTLLDQARHRAAMDEVEALTRFRGDQLLAGEDGDWLATYRQEIDSIALRALEIVVPAAGAVGEHGIAIDLARRSVERNQLDERAHRCLVRALDQAGDRAGAVQAYTNCRLVLAEQLGVDPSPATVAVYMDALRDQGGSAVARLPIVTSTFIGRDVETSALRKAISAPGLVTVTGSGGVGKSRLITHVASTSGDLFDARLWVSLGSTTEDELVDSTVALALGAPLGIDDAAVAIAAQLAPLGRVLVVLDGSEGVRDGVASLVTALVVEAPTATVVVSSRVALAVDDETLLRIEPFAPPSTDDVVELAVSPQVRLLMDRVRGGGGRLELDAQIAPMLAALCRRCGGLPLALELAAAQLTAMPVGDLIDHLSELLTEGEDGLRAVARGSIALLDEDELAVFRRFAVLDGAVGLALARNVVAGGHTAPVRVVRVLRELTARGLLMVDSVGARWRYQQDDDLHRLAGELLLESGEQTLVLTRLADAVMALLPEDARAAPTVFQDAVTDVLAGVRTVLGSALDGRLSIDLGLELAFRLHRYWAGTNVAEGRFWLGRLLADDPQSPWAGYATFALGYLSYWSGDVDSAVPELEAAVELLGDAEDSYAARALIYLAGLADDLDRGADALDYVGRAVEAARRYGVDLQVGAAMGMACVLAERADPNAASYAADALALCRAGGSPEQLAATLPTAAMVCWQVGALDDARAYIAEAMPIHARGRRIARVVLFSAAAAVDYGRTADSEATELGVERELPLIRCLLAHSLLAGGDIAGAAERARAAVVAARALSYDYPMANCLETVAVVARAEGSGNAVVSRLLDSAAVLRARGDRPVPPTLRAAVTAARSEFDIAMDAQVTPLDVIAELALELLAAPTAAQ
jgi:predicted ATPase/DNA-binding SARP family transcriptional activator